MLGFIEQFGPFFFGVAVGAVSAVASLKWGINTIPTALPAGAMTFGIVVAGFTATQRNMLLTMGASRTLRFMTKNHLDYRVLGYFMHCIYAGLVVSGIAAIGFFLNCVSPYHIIWFSCLLGGIAVVLALIGRNELVMRIMVRRFLTESTQANNPR